MYEVILNNEGVETIINAVSVDLSSPKLLNGNIKQGINNIDSFMFNILPNNSGYNCIGSFKSTVEVINTIGGKTVFRGRVLIAKEKMSEDGKLIKTVVCEGELGYLMDSCSGQRQSLSYPGKSETGSICITSLIKIPIHYIMI